MSIGRGRGWKAAPFGHHRRPSMTRLRSFFLTGITALALAGCGDNAHLPREAGYGPHPTLPAPQKSLISFVHIAPAKGWQESGGPIAAPGLTLTAFARGLNHPRWLYVLPNGDVLVAETNAPPKPDDSKGIEGWVHEPGHEAGRRRRAQSPNRILLLRDTNGDGRRRYPHDLPHRPELALRHGAGGRHALCRRHRCGAALSLQDAARPQISDNAARRWWTCRPVPSTITGPRT